MERSFTARLSPSEENTLRLLTHGIAEGEFLNSGHVNRLVLLELVSIDGTTITVTSLGTQRIVRAN